MAKAIISQVGEALYGKRWVKPLADELNVSESTMGRVKRGDDVRKRTWVEIRRAIERRQVELEKVRIAVLEHLASL